MQQHNCWLSTYFLPFNIRDVIVMAMRSDFCRDRVSSRRAYFANTYKEKNCRIPLKKKKWRSTLGDLAEQNEPSMK